MEKKTLGMTVSALRKEKGMTQTQLAEQLGVTDKAVSKWERDISCPDINTLPRLAEILGVSVNDLMQSTPKCQTGDKTAKIKDMISLALKELACAAGVIVAVLSVIELIDMYTGFTLLGIGLACAGLSLLLKK